MKIAIYPSTQVKLGFDFDTKFLKACEYYIVYNERKNTAYIDITIQYLLNGPFKKNIDMIDEIIEKVLWYLGFRNLKFTVNSTESFPHLNLKFTNETLFTIKLMSDENNIVYVDIPNL